MRATKKCLILLLTVCITFSCMNITVYATDTTAEKSKSVLEKLGEYINNSDVIPQSVKDALKATGSVVMGVGDTAKEAINNATDKDSNTTVSGAVGNLSTNVNKRLEEGKGGTTSGVTSTCTSVEASKYNSLESVKEMKYVGTLIEQNEETGEYYINTESENYKKIQKIWSILMNTYSNPAIASGIIGNWIQESNLDPTVSSPSGSYKGIAQWSTSRYADMVQYLNSDNNMKNSNFTPESVEGQTYFAIHEYSSLTVNSSSLTGVDTATLLASKDIDLQTEAFMVLFERAVTDKHTDANAIISAPIKTARGDKAYYQEMAIRRDYATGVFVVMQGAELLSYISGNQDLTNDAQQLQDQIENESGKSEAALTRKKLGITEQNWYDKTIALPGRDALSDKEIYTLENWKSDSEFQQTNGVVNTIRMIIAILGILIMIWGFLLYMAYWLDKFNNFIEFSFLNFLSFDQLELAPDESDSTFSPLTKGKKAVNHKDMIFVLFTVEAIGVVMLTGLIYRLAFWIYTMVVNFFDKFL